MREQIQHEGLTWTTPGRKLESPSVLRCRTSLSDVQLGRSLLRKLSSSPQSCRKASFHQHQMRLSCSRRFLLGPSRPISTCGFKTCFLKHAMTGISCCCRHISSITALTEATRACLDVGSLCQASRAGSCLLRRRPLESRTGRLSFLKLSPISTFRR